MQLDVQDMQYPLKERIGLSRLYVDREAVFSEYEKWVSLIPKELSKSRAILARKKSGKTAFIQRLFNRLWSKNGDVVPFYLEIPDDRVWFPDFARLYFRTFASQYISFLERDQTYVRDLLSLEEIQEYGQEKGLRLLVKDVASLGGDFKSGFHGAMWRTARTCGARKTTA